MYQFLLLPKPQFRGLVTDFVIWTDKLLYGLKSNENHEIYLQRHHNLVLDIVQKLIIWTKALRTIFLTIFLRIFRSNIMGQETMTSERRFRTAVYEFCNALILSINCSFFSLSLS
eukprot:328573_1